MAYNRSVFPKAKIVVDIETVVVPPTDEAIEAAKRDYEPPKNYKDPDKIAAHRDAFFANLAESVADKNKFKINGKRMICCGLGIADTKTRTVLDLQAFYGDNLNLVMHGVVGYINKYGQHGWQLIGYNHTKFDWPELMKCGELTDTAPEVPVERWDVIDLHQKVFFGEKLADVAAAFQKKKSGAGSEVAKMYANGDWEAIASYCKNDVRVTGEIYLRCNRWQEL